MAAELPAYKTVLQSFVAPGVLLLTLSRPKQRNAVNGQMLGEITNALNRVSELSSVQCVIVTGDPNGKAFCAGADLKASGFGSSGEKAVGEYVLNTMNSTDLREYRDTGGFTSLAALRCSKPIICAINGAAVGWGMAFSIACDMRVVADNAKVGFPMAARGLVNESISSFLLPRLIGPSRAKELVYTARIMLANELAAIAPNLFNYVVPESEVLPKAISIANEIVANCSPMSVTMCKYLMNDAVNSENSSPEKAMLNESKCLHHVNFVKNADIMEGVGSFLQKRKPEWKLKSYEDLPQFLPFSPVLDVNPESKSKL